LTPHLQIAYEPADFGVFRETGATWAVIDENVPEPVGAIAKVSPRSSR
jgi:hypothetical protein